MIRRYWSLVGVCAMVFAGCTAEVGDLGVNGEEARRTLFCGGIAGFACPDGYQCVDDPRDDCDPTAGGADCGGICERVRRTRCTRDPSRIYVSRDPSECALVRFVCAEGQTAFSDACGCGCEDAQGEACGPVTCGAGQVCCNASCGICTAPGDFCIQLPCE